MLIQVTPDDYPVLLTVWESSVRATHFFLHEEDIVKLRHEIPGYFDAVTLRGWRNEQGTISGFIGIHGQNIEMLFVDANARGLGAGKALLKWALEQDAHSVDVNEQNPQAIGFYEHMGFRVTGRSPLDGQGRAFPLLHMRIIRPS